MNRWAEITGLRLALLVNRYRIWCLTKNDKQCPRTCAALIYEARKRRAELLKRLKETNG